LVMEGRFCWDRRKHMGCCGKVKSIAVGSVNLATGIKYEFTDSRIRICQGCVYNTWMSAVEYSAWLLTHGIEVLANFDQLEKLPMLPKHEQSKARRRLYCRICKCYIPAKARVKHLKCPQGMWR